MDLYLKHSPDDMPFEDSAYYYWYLFMQQVEGYSPKHPLWKDFGDVCMEFWEWWCTHGESIFSTGNELGIWQLDTDEEIKKARRDGALIVRVDTNCTRDWLLNYFNEFLDDNKIGKKIGRRKHAEEVKGALYPFYQRPDVNALRKTWEVWEMRDQEPRPTLYEIGVALNLNYSAVIKHGDTKAIITEKKNLMNATTSRYLRWAKNIIRNVGKGKFPKTD